MNTVLDSIKDDLLSLKNDNFELNKKNISMFSQYENYTLRRILDENGIFIRYEILNAEPVKSINLWFIGLYNTIYNLPENDLPSLINKSITKANDMTFDKIIKELSFKPEKKMYSKIDTKNGTITITTEEYNFQLSKHTELIEGYLEKYNTKLLMESYFTAIDEFKNKLDSLSKQDSDVMSLIADL